MGAKYEVRGNVAVVTLDNPPVNGLGYDTRREFSAGIERAEARRELTLRTPFVGMGVPARGVEHGDLQAVLTRKERTGRPHGFQVASTRRALCRLHRGLASDVVRGERIRKSQGQHRVAGIQVGDARECIVVERWQA